MQATKGSYLRFYVQEKRRHGGKLLYEWLLEAAKGAGVEGGSAFRAIAGDGNVEVKFFVSTEQAASLLGLLKREGLQIFYAMVPADFGVSGS